MRILGIDHGDVRIGLAISDETGAVARPLQIVVHVSREKDAETVARIVRDTDSTLIVVGLPTDSEGEIGPRARKVQRWADAVGQAAAVPIEFWDETFSSQAVEASRRKRKRDEPIDAHAAAVILQSYLDAHRPAPDDPAGPPA
jgi:putative holliday junction resolvase